MQWLQENIFSNVYSVRLSRHVTLGVSMCCTLVQHCTTWTEGNTGTV